MLTHIQYNSWEFYSPLQSLILHHLNYNQYKKNSLPISIQAYLQVCHWPGRILRVVGSMLGSPVIK